MNHRKKKKMQKHARWVFVSCYELMGGDYSCWCAHGNPVAEIVCSNCGESAPMVKGKEESLDVMRYSILKKKCPKCGCRMDAWKRRYRRWSE